MKKIYASDDKNENIEVIEFNDAIGIAITSTMFVGLKPGPEKIKSGTVDFSIEEIEELIFVLKKAVRNVKNYIKMGA